ncbi:hypothetical protein SKAU_G00253910 [Synaphobranchus kaupii]|uniref:Thioredoxin domain-containing protein n=1 Tax=Synaphobranchus kaupii TaxID=118154 RepID=A0A9Q1F3L3_SYNKA|nr:hypothetical protein SKAU_G00253910 [Synaphobranchus kaupii]
MKAMYHALSFFLVCLLAYYIALVIQRKEELSLKKHSESSHSRQEAHSPAPARVEEPSESHNPAPAPADEPSESHNPAPAPAEKPSESHSSAPAPVDEPSESHSPAPAPAEKPSESHSSAPAPVDEPSESHSPAPAPAEEPSESLSPAPAPVDEPSESLQDVAPEDEADLPIEVPKAEGEEERQQPHALARGWGGDIDWAETYEEALRMARISQKPLMVIHHLENCPICKALKAAFSGHEEIQGMAKEDFIMFNVVHETNDHNLAPDGYYVPRIIFIDPALVIRGDITGKGQKYKYSYTDNDMQR